MNADEALAMGYVGMIEIRVPAEGEPVQTVYPLGDTQLEDLKDNAIVRFKRFWEHGPEPDGWGVWTVPEFDGTIYQLLTRWVVLPDLGADV